MKAVILPREESTPRVVERERPVPADGEVLVRTLAVGIDGSDRRIVDGEIGSPPTGDDHLVLGHEAVGVVAQPNGSTLETGDVVAPLVRRPAGDRSEYAERGELDMAPPDAFYERGILGAHGYMAEYFVSETAYLVPVPDSRAAYGFFVEPASIVEKGLEQAYAARSAFEWQPLSALVLGNGNLGLLALARLESEPAFEMTYCLGRRDRPDPTIEFVERVGGTYVDSRETPLGGFADQYEEVDFVFEATGYPNYAVDAVEALGPNGVATLQGIPGSQPIDIDGGAFHADIVVNNKALLGVVNSRAEHFRSAAEWVGEMSEDVLPDLVTGVYEPNEIDRALEDSDETIKTVVSFDDEVTFELSGRE